MHTVLVYALGVLMLVVLFIPTVEEKAKRAQKQPSPGAKRNGQGGWLWFASTKKGDKVKLGVSVKDPAELWDARTLTLLWKQPVDNRKLAQAQVARELDFARLGSGQFYDFDAAQAYISHLKGEW